MTQYSMARNGSDYLSGKPDTRTGLFAKTLSLGNLKGNYQTGPSFKLQLGFNPQQDFMNYATPFGSGWGLSVPAFLRSTSFGDGHLTLPSGKSFYITEVVEGYLSMEGYLLSDVQITWSSTDNVLTVREKSGDIHYYRALAGDQSSGNLYLFQTTSDDGLSLYFSYDNSKFSDPTPAMLVCLTEVTDDAGTQLVSVDYSGSRGTGTVITLVSESDTPRQFTFMQQGNDLNTVYGPEGYQATFTYYDNGADGGVPMHLISTVADTSGLYEQVTYSDPSTGGITLPGGTQTQNTVLCYRRAGDVTDGSTDYVAYYNFGTPGSSQKNYLGNPVITSSPVDERIDSLLHYHGAFTYSSTLTEQVNWPFRNGNTVSDILVNKVTTTMYNKFHSMLTKEVTFSSDDLAGKTLFDGNHKLTETLAYAATDDTIDKQVPTYALPLSHTKTWSNGSSSSTEEQFFTWDNFANLETHVSKSGVKTERIYYYSDVAEETDWPPETGCPPDPNHFVRHLQQKIVTPGTPSTSGLPAAPVRQYDYTYDNVSGHGSSTPVRRTEMTQSEDAGTNWVQKKNWQWYADTYLLESVHLLSTSSTLQDKTTVSAFKYSLEDNNTTLRTVVTRTGYDALVHQERIDRSVVTGKIKASADLTALDNQHAVTMTYAHDALGRVTEKTACQGTPYEASQTIIYIASPLKQAVVAPHQLNLNPRLGFVPSANPEKIITNARWVQSKSVMDSVGNTLEQWQQDADGVVRGISTDLYMVSQSGYDSLGNTLSTTSFDWFPGDATTPSVAATTTTFYDAWGEQYATQTSTTQTPYGHIETSQHDPITRTTFSSLTGTDGVEMQKQQDTEDVGGNVLKTERLNIDGSVYSTETSDYDGLARQVRSTDSVNNVTLKSLDAFDRPLKVTRPDGSVMTPSWAPHSTHSLMNAIAVTDATGADSYTYGTRDFDGLNRVTTMTVGGRKTDYSYSDGSAQKPTQVKMPAGATLMYTYQSELNEAMLSVTSDASGEEATLTYSYDRTTGDVWTSGSDIAGDDYAYRKLTYTPSGQLQKNSLTYYCLKEAKEVTNEQSMTMSLGGKVLTTTDAGGLAHKKSYDGFGRQYEYTLSCDSDILTTVGYRYDSAGRQDQTITTDIRSGNVQTTTLTWDEFGRELQRTLTVSGSLSATQVQILDYFDNDQIQARKTTRDGQPLRTETYQYTPLGQMSAYTCSGDYPDSPDGYRLTAQQFTFDFIGNISTVTSSLLDAGNAVVTNSATYTTGTTDRTLLMSITNDTVTAWNATLSYDGNGNMTTDEQQRRLTYNSRSQLMSLSDPQSQPLGWFRYDADGIQIAEKSEMDTDATMLFYQTDGGLMNELQGPLSSTYMDTLACAFRGDGTDSVQLLGTDQQGSVVQQSDESEMTWRVYDPYGYSK